MEKSKAELLFELGESISALSQNGYCAGWLIGIERIIPETCERIIANQKPESFGFITISIEDAQELVGMAKKLGHWVDYDGIQDRYIPYNPLDR